MSGTAIALVLLGVVDVVALSIGVSIRLRLTKIVGETAASIEAHVKAGIADAVGKIVNIAGELLRAQGKGDVADRVLDELRR